MAFTFNITPPVSDRNQLRINIGDVTVSDGPAPDRSNLSDELLDRFLTLADSVPGATAMAFDHLATLWISRPIFGPGELSTVHTNLYEKFRKAAEDWRGRSSDPDVVGPLPAVTFEVIEY